MTTIPRTDYFAALYSNTHLLSLMIYLLLLLTTRAFRILSQTHVESKIIAFLDVFSNYILQLATAIGVITALFGIPYIHEHFSGAYNAVLLISLAFVHYTTMSTKRNLFSWAFNVVAKKRLGETYPMNNERQSNNRRRVFGESTSDDQL